MNKFLFFPVLMMMYFMVPSDVYVEHSWSKYNDNLVRVVNNSNENVRCYIDGHEFRLKPKTTSRWYVTLEVYEWGCD